MGEVALPNLEPLLGEHHDGPTLWGVIGEAGELRRSGKALGRDPWQGEEICSLTVAECDGPRLVEKEGGAVACGLDRAP